MHYIVDLDNTVICSKHRQATFADGSLDLEHWIEHNQSEQIAKDSILPAIKLMRTAYMTCTVVICTARVLGDADYAFFMEHNVPFHHVLSRPQGCMLGDAELKDVQLRLYAQSLDLSWRRFSANAIILEDNQDVLTRMKFIGIRTIDAVEINARMTA
jgi:hypothetical protein